MSSHALHRTPCGHVQKTTVWERLELGNLEIFDPVAQESYQLSPTMIHTNSIAWLRNETSRATWRTTTYTQSRSRNWEQRTKLETRATSCHWTKESELLEQKMKLKWILEPSSKMTDRGTQCSTHETETRAWPNREQEWRKDLPVKQKAEQEHEIHRWQETAWERHERSWAHRPMGKSKAAEEN
jgi:hypothetical protein